MIRSLVNHLVAACVAVSSLLVGCGGGASSQSSTDMLVGTVSSTDAVVGLVLNGDDAFVFFCGGPKTLQSLTHWMHGTIKPGEPFEITDGAVTASGTVVGGHASGTLKVTSSGSAQPWTADAPAGGTIAGIYSKQIPSEGLADLVVLPASAGEEPVAQGAFRTTSNAVFQVTPLHPIASTSQGVGVKVSFSGAEHEEFLTPATAD